MKTALDSSVILDVLTNDPNHADGSETVLRQALAVGPLVIGECVLAEITPAFANNELADFLAAWQIQFVSSTQESAQLAGTIYRRYLERRKGAKRVLPDFLIGAHALHHTGRLVARDRGYYRDYFDGLTLIQPATGS